MKIVGTQSVAQFRSVVQEMEWTTRNKHINTQNTQKKYQQAGVDKCGEATTVVFLSDCCTNKRQNQLNSSLVMLCQQPDMNTFEQTLSCVGLKHSYSLQMKSKSSIRLQMLLERRLLQN